MTRYKVVRQGLEYEEGSTLVITSGQPLIMAEAYLFRIGKFLIVGHWFPGWVIQHGRWIELGNTVIYVVGRVVHSLM